MPSVEMVFVIRAVSGFQRVWAIFAYLIMWTSFYVDLIFRDFVYVFLT